MSIGDKHVVHVDAPHNKTLFPTAHTLLHDIMQLFTACTAVNCGVMRQMNMRAGIRTSYRNNYSAARESLELWLSASAEWEKKYGDGNNICIHALRDSKYVKHQMLNFVLQVAITAEAFINFYGGYHKIENISSYSSSLSVKQKWLLYPRLAEGKNLDGVVVPQLKLIKHFRDQVVHPKYNWRDEAFCPVKPVFLPINGAGLFNCLNKLLKALNDSTYPFEREWLSEDILDHRTPTTNMQIIH